MYIYIFFSGGFQKTESLVKMRDIIETKVKQEIRKNLMTSCMTRGYFMIVQWLQAS